MKAVRYLIGGKVQGVWFRASARDQAVALNLRGFARNLADGRVEVLAIGDDESVDQLGQWLRFGPELAHVDELERIETDEDVDVDGFEIR